jgi:hypothetical protein
MKHIKPFRFEWRAISPSFLQWQDVEVFFCGGDYGWAIVNNGVHFPDKFFRRDDAINFAEQTYSLPVVL